MPDTISRTSSPLSEEELDEIIKEVEEEDDDWEPEPRITTEQNILLQLNFMSDILRNIGRLVVLIVILLLYLIFR